MHSVLEEVVPLPTWTMSPKRLRCLIMYVMPTSMSLRFSSPVYPGETIRTEIWDEGGGAFVFRAVVEERDVVVLDQGRAAVSG